MTGDYATGKTIYTQYIGFKFENGKRWQEMILADFEALKNANVIHPDFAKIAKDVFKVAKKLPN